MATPTGVLWPSFSPEDSTRIRKWLYGNVLIRDWDPAGSTNMNNIQVFSSNGNLNPNLLVPVALGGYGFYDVGNITEAGVEFTPQFTADETYVWQSRKSQRTDITKDDEEVMFTCSDSTPLVDYLFYNLPIGFNGIPLFPSIGTSGYTVTKPFYSDVVYRQLLIIGVDGSVGPGGQPEYAIELRPRVSISKKAKKQWTAKNVDVTELTFTCHVDPASGYDMQTQRGGTVWLDEGGPVTLPAGLAFTSPPTVNTATINPPTGFAQTPSGSGGGTAFASGGTFYWVITATTALGETTRSSELTSTLASNGSNALSWTQVTGATGYKIYRGTSPGGETALVTTIGSGATVTFTDVGATGTAFSPPGTNTACIAVPGSVTSTPSTTGGNLPAVAEFWVVTALTANGETNASSEVTSTLTTATSSSAIGWGATSGATGFKVYRGLTTGAENTLVTLPSTASGATSFTDRGATVVATSPVATQATLKFNVPPLPVQTYTYTVTQQVGGSGAFTASSILTTTTTAGIVTIVVQSLTTSSSYVFAVTATAANNNSATYPNSNSITIT